MKKFTLAILTIALSSTAVYAIDNKMSEKEGSVNLASTQVAQVDVEQFPKAIDSAQNTLNKTKSPEGKFKRELRERERKVMELDKKAEKLDRIAERYDSRALRLEKRIERMKKMTPEEQKEWLKDHKHDRKGKGFKGDRDFHKKSFDRKRMNPETKERLKETCLETDNGKKLEPFDLEKAKAKLMSSEKFVKAPKEKQEKILKNLEEFNKLSDTEKKEIQNFKQEHLIKICDKLKK